MSCTQRRFAWRVLSLSLLSAALVLLLGVARRHDLIPPSLRWAAALIPVVPMIWFFLALGPWLRSLDELQRQIQLEALLVQFGITGVFILAYGSLAKYGVLPDSAVSDAWAWFWLVLFLSWAIGQLVVRRKYQ